MYDIRLEWNNLKNTAVKPVWNMFRRQYEMVGLGYDDFESIAYIYLEKEIKMYEPSKSSITTYAVNILKRRMGDYIRNNFNTDKTRANFCPQSLNAPVADDSEIEMGEALVDHTTEYKAENNVNKIKRFLKTLSHQQKEILLLSAIGLDSNEIQFVMNIDQSEYEQNMQKITTPRRISILRNGVN